MLQKIVGPQGPQVPSYRRETVRVRPVQVTVQREDEAGQAYLRPHRREALQVRLLRTSVRRTVPAKGAQVLHGHSKYVEDEDRG